jgi:D-beta-D-heptose 7-phosphate kinase/D-beta-D-heptose 1-phosphate adenosyltransferase
MKTVLTNGCFVEVTDWHKKMLQEASQYGKVIVLMNSTKSIEKLKNYRNVPSDEYRKNQLLSLPYVADVYIFDETSPIKIMKQMKADFYFKGGDYDINSINQLERKILEKNGTKIMFAKEYKKDYGYYVKNGYAKKCD